MASINSSKGDVGVDRSVNSVNAPRTSTSTVDDHSYRYHHDASVQDNHARVVDKSKRITKTKLVVNSVWPIVIVAIAALWFSRQPAPTVMITPPAPTAVSPTETAKPTTADHSAAPPPTSTPPPVADRVRSATSVRVDNRRAPVDPPEPLALSLAVTLVNRPNFNRSAPAVLIRGGVHDEEFSQQLASALGGTDALFTKAFIDSGRFARARAGESAALADLDLNEAASLILLGTRRTSITPQEVAGQRLFKADASVTVRVFSPRQGLGSESFTEHAIGSGFNEPDAERTADQRLIEQLTARLRAERPEPEVIDVEASGQPQDQLPAGSREAYNDAVATATLLAKAHFLAWRRGEITHVREIEGVKTIRAETLLVARGQVRGGRTISQSSIEDFRTTGIVHVKVRFPVSADVTPRQEE